jgi:GTPase SAR1 family protein
MDVKKIVVIGDSKVGKSSLIQAYLELPSDQHLPHSRALDSKSAAKSQMDFVTKIVNMKGIRMRVQLWELVGGTVNGPEGTTLPPLFIRHCVGCIIVARSDSQASI